MTLKLIKFLIKKRKETERNVTLAAKRWKMFTFLMLQTRGQNKKWSSEEARGASALILPRGLLPAPLRPIAPLLIYRRVSRHKRYGSTSEQ